MPKVIGPMLSLDARGTVGKAFYFQNRPSGPAAARRTVPHDPKNASQLVIRSYVREAINKWKALQEWEKDFWREYVKSTDYYVA